MNDGGGVSLGEWGGILAGVATILATMIAGMKWLFGWNDRRDVRRSKKLQAWHAELTAREQRLDAERATYTAGIERELQDLQVWRAQMMKEHAALNASHQLLSAALRTIDPANAALRMADELLREAFPPIIATPPDMKAMLDQIDAADSGEKQ